MSKRSICRYVNLLLYGLVVLGFTLGSLACKSNAAVQHTPTPEPGVTATAIPTATDTSVPSPSAQPEAAILVAPPGSDLALAEVLETRLSELASEDGIRFETQDQLAESGLGAGVRLVVVLSPDPGVLNLAQTNPETQFLALGIPDMEASQNVSVIGSAGDRPDQQGFLAGYLAAVITEDWRVGVVSSADAPAGLAARRGFENGVIFYCGLCRPAYPPFFQYPVSVDLPGGASQEEQKAAADALIASAVQTVYVYPGAGGQALLDELAQAGINIIGGAAPPDSVQEQWVATVRVDLLSALEQIWPDLVSGEGGINMDVPLLLTDRNEALFSPGRQRLVEKMLADLLAGYIDTGVDPQTGEPR